MARHGMVRAAAAAAAASELRPEPSGAALRRQAFERDGFLILPSVLSRADVQKYRGMAEDLVARAAGLTEGVSSDAGHSFSLEVDGAGAAVPGFLHKVQGVNTAERRFLEIARHPAVFPIVQELLGSAELDIFGTKFFPKLGATDALPTGGISVRWHQDNFAFGADVHADRAKQERILSMATYLHDSDHDNGCFQLVRPHCPAARRSLLTAVCVVCRSPARTGTASSPRRRTATRTRWRSSPRTSSCLQAPSPSPIRSRCRVRPARSCYSAPT